MSEITTSNKSLFDSIRKTDERGCEYWVARDLQEVLEYDEWRKFAGGINKATIACSTIGADPKNHIVGAATMVEIGSGASREVLDYKLSRLGSYLVTMNCDARKPRVAEAQLYFAAMTIKAEVLGNAQKPKTETELFSDRNLELAKQIAQTAKAAVIEANQLRAENQDLKSRLTKFEAPALPPADGMRFKELLRCCGLVIDSADGSLFSRMSADFRRAVKAGELPKTAIAGHKYRFCREVQVWAMGWVSR